MNNQLQSKSPTRIFRWVTVMMLLTLCGFNSMAQVAMTRSTFTGAYATISGTVATAAQADNGNFAATIPFTFNYLGVGYTACNINSNGYINFGAAIASNSNSTLFTVTTPQGVVAPWFDDMFPTSVQFTTTGTTPNQVFTVQWVGPSYWTGVTLRNVSYQVKLYETTNVIEFWYDTPTGTLANASVSESASIGLENLTGGPGNFLDAVSGSSQIGNGTLNSGQWPTLNYRFTPGAPTAIAGGTYNVGTGQTYPTLTEAVADINHRGISGAITLNLTDAFYTDKGAGGDEIFPITFATVSGTSAVNTITLNGNDAELRYAGSVSGTWNNGSASGTMFGTTAEPILGVCGTDYLNINSIKLSSLIGIVFGSNTGIPTRVDRGLAVQNSGAINGSTFNNFTGITITLDRTNTSTMAIDQGNSTAPTSAAGANSNNIYKNLTIKNTQKGISLGGNATYPDLNCEIGTTSCTAFNTIGDPATPNDIGNTTVSTFGIQAANQSGVSIYNNSVRNVTGSAIQVDGINITGAQGTCSIYNNIVRTIRNSSTSSTTGISGIGLAHATTGTVNVRCYNNSVSEILTSYTGAATATRVARGIWVRGTGGGVTQTHEVWNNNVSIDGTGNLNASNSCFEISTASGCVFTVRNNIFANYTPAQGATAKHSGIYSTSATSLGNTGTTFQNNNVWIANDAGTSGFTANGNGTTYNGVTAWQTAMPLATANVNPAVDPIYVNSNTDLHATASGLNGAGQTPPAYVIVDLDCATRTPDNDIGAYKIDGCSSANGGTASFTGGALSCEGLTKTMSSTGATAPAAGLTYQWEISSTGGGIGFANVSGGSGANTTSYTTGSLAAGVYYYRLNVTCSSGPTTAYSNEIILTVNAAPTVTVTPSSATICQPGGSSVSLTGGGAVSYAWSPTSGLTPTSGSPVSANPFVTTTYTVTGTDGNGCTNTATSVITVAPSITATATATPPAVCSGSNSQLNVTTVPAPGAGAIKITEVCLNRGGTGGGVYPAFAPGADLVEITNISSSPVDVSGWTLSDHASNTAAVTHTGFAFPASTIIPANSVAIVCFGTGTADIPNRYYVSGGTSDFWSSSSLVGFVLKNGSTVVDAVGCGSGYVFNVGTGVTAGDWSGFAPSASGLAGTTRTAANDNNIGADWVGASVGSPQTIGVYNAGYTPPITIASYAWTPSTFIAGQEALQNPLANAVTSTQAYSVLVTTTDGCTATAGVTVSVAPLTCTAATFTSPNCAGSNFTVTANPSNGGAPYSYSWDDGVGGVYANSATITANLPAGTYTFVCTVTDACLATCTSSVSVTVNPLPTVTLSPSTGQICIPGGSAITLTAGGATSYAWSPTDGLTPTTGSPVSANPTSTTNYIVTGTDVNGCTSTASSLITVSAAVTGTTATATPGTLCEGSTLNLTSSASVAGAYTMNGNSGVSFIDISGTGTSVGVLADDSEHNITIPSFTFNGTAYTTARVGNNGAIVFNSASGEITHVNAALPSTANTAGNIALMPYWDDLDIQLGATCVTQTVGNLFIIQYTNSTHDAFITGAITFQVQLDLTNGQIHFVYSDVIFGDVLYDAGVNATIGIQYSGTSATQYSHLTASLVNGQSISFTPQTLSYLWSGPNSFTSGVQNPSIASASPAASGVYTVTVTSSEGCTASANTASVTVNAYPVADAPANVTACDSYTLPALGVGNYFTGSGGTGTALSAGNVISSTQLIYVYAETGTTPNCTDENSFTVTINTTPVADAPANVTACDSYTLPALGVGNYFTGIGGTGTALSAGNSITSTQLIYVYAETGTTPNCTDENSFTVTINTTPVADAPANVTACDSYTLPALIVGNYFTGTGGTGTALFAGNVISSTQLIYVYAETGTTPNCTDENSFTVTINVTPSADAPSNVTACDSYTLPALTVGNYFTGTGGTGTALSAGNSITSTQLIYVYAETGTTPNCTDENSFTVTINVSPSADAPANVSACDSYTLPALTVGNYFTGTGGTGTALSAGNTITSTQLIYVYAETGTTPNCTDENSFTVTINSTPSADAPSNVTACDSYTLPALTVGNYFTGTGGTGTALSAGNSITSTQLIYVYAETGTTPNCTDENSFTVNINVTPNADAPANVAACGSYTLPSLTVGNYFTGTGGTGTALFAGNNITSTQTIYVYAETGTTPNCIDENSFVVTISTAPTASISGDNTICEGSSTNLTLNFTGTAPWLYAINGGTPVSTSNNPETVSVSPITNTVYTITSISDAACTGSASGSATINVDAAPTTAVAGPDQGVLVNSATLAGNTPSVGTGLWTVTAGTGVFVNANDPGTVVNGLSAGLNTFRWTTSNGVCADSFDEVNITFSNCVNPAASISGDAEICNGGSTNLTLTFTGVAPFTYAINGGAPVLTSNTTEIVSVTPGVTTVYTITSFSDALCSGISNGSATVTVTNAPPASSCTITTITVDACVGNIVVVSTNVVPGATSYTWSAPAGTLIDGFASPYTSATNSVNITLGNVPTNSSGWLICAFASNACGSTNTNCKPIRGTLSTPSAIAGSTVACPSTGPSNYSTTAVGGASSYLWTITGDASVTGTGITAAVTFGPTFTTGSLCVRALLPCGFQGAQRCLTIANGTPILGVMTGTFTVCPGTNGVAFSVPPSLGATTYNWTLPAGASIANGAGTNSITVDFGPSYTNGNVCVTAQSICGATSLPRCKTVASITPGTPGNFTTGATTGVCGQTITYNVNTVSGATGYTWTAPAGASLASANGTNTIDIAFGPGYTTGNVCVTANNACGSGTPRCVVVKGNPANAGPITGLNSVCANDAGINYSIAPVFGATGYVWTVPSGATIVSGQGTTSIIVDWGTNGGTIGVTASGTCGNSGTRTLAVAMTCRVSSSTLAGASVNAYPNPVSTQLNIELNAINAGNYTLELMDLAGRVIYSDVITATEGSNNAVIDVATYAKGVYTMRVRNSNGFAQQIRVVVE